MPWSKSRSRSRKGDFYKGAFDTIPFLNDDAKRTFVHLLLRPGYMIRDYIKGQHERYLAPLTSLIIFYAFFALISAIVNPEYSSYHPEASSASRAARDSVLLVSTPQTNPADSLSESDFIGQQAAALGKDMNKSACAATAAYVLCQFCFFMFFSLFFAVEEKGEIGVGLMAVLLAIDYVQLFGLGWKKSLGLTIKTGWYYLLTLLALIVLLIGIVALYVGVSASAAA